MVRPAVLYNLRLFHDKLRREEQIGGRIDAKISPHISPGSTLICAIGNYWQPGCLQAVLEMVRYTHDQGYEVALYEERDRCYQPFDAIGSMRNTAYLRAREEGWEFVLYVDNDVRPHQDALVRLLSRWVPIISPKIIYSDGDAHGLDMPKMEEGRGLALVGSVVLSFILFKTAVFAPWWQGDFWGNAIGDDEEVHFRKLAQVGHRPFVDTDVVVECVNPPHFPLDSQPRHNGPGKLWRP